MVGASELDIQVSSAIVKHFHVNLPYNGGLLIFGVHEGCLHSNRLHCYLCVLFTRERYLHSTSRLQVREHSLLTIRMTLLSGCCCFGVQIPFAHRTSLILAGLPPFLIID